MRSFFTLIALVLSLSASSQTWEWVKKGTASPYGGYQDMAVSPEGTLFTSQSWVDYNTWPQKREILVASYNSQGVLLWTDTIKTQHNLNYSQNNSTIYYFNGNAFLLTDFSYSINVKGTIFTANGIKNTLLIRYSPNGNVSMVKHLKCFGEINTAQLTVDSLNNIYLIGSFEKTLTLDDSVLISKGKRNLFIAKYNNAGIITRIMHGWNIDTSDYFSQIRGTSIVVDKQQNLVVGGRFNAGFVFKNIIDSFITNEPFRHFILRIAPDESIIASQFRNEGGSSNYYRNFIFDSNNNLSLIMDVGANHGGFSQIIKLNTNFQEVDTIRYSSKTGYASYTNFANIIYDKNDNLYFSGKRVENYVAPFDASDAFYLTFAKYNSSFNLMYMDSSVTDEKAFYTKILCDSSNNIYLQGYYYNSVFISGTTLSSPVNKHAMFLAKINQTGVVGLAENKPNKLNFSIAPNPSEGVYRIEGRNNNFCNVLVYNSLGQKVAEESGPTSSINIDLLNNPSGMYLVEVIINDQKSIKKIIKR